MQSGWIKDAEEAAFQVATGPIQGNWTTLNAEALRRVALLATIIAAAADLDHPPTTAIPQSDRDFVFNNHAPPPSWGIFIGRINDALWRTKWRHYGIELIEAGPFIHPNECNTQTTTIGMGEVLLHTMSVPPDMGPIDIRETANSLGMAPIFPFSGDLAPDAVPFLDRGHIEAAADGFANWVATLVPP